MNNAQQLYDKFTKSTDPKIIVKTAHEINKHFKWIWGQEPIDEIGEEFLYIIDAKQESFEWLILMMIHQLNGVGYHEYFTVLENRENSISDVQCKWGKIVLKEIQNQMTEPFKGYTSELIKVFERVIESSTQQEKDTDLRDDKLYKTINIGNQIWMVENLNVDKFRNGDPIPHCKTIEEWTEAGYEGKPAWCYYENNTEKGNIYGKLYNWYAVNDPRRLEPAGWHVPTDEEWKVLEMVLGMSRAEVDGFGPRGTNEGSKLAGNEALWADGNLKSNKNHLFICL